MADNEVRITSATGGQKGSKPQQISTIDPAALLALSEVGAFGAQKYSAYNYLKGYDWDLTYDAAQRHLMSFWNGEDRDPESDLLHVLHAAWHCLAMASFIIRDLGTDTRFKGNTDNDSLLDALRLPKLEPIDDEESPDVPVSGGAWTPRKRRVDKGMEGSINDDDET